MVYESRFFINLPVSIGFIGKKKKIEQGIDTVLDEFDSVIGQRAIKTMTEKDNLKSILYTSPKFSFQIDCISRRNNDANSDSWNIHVGYTSPEVYEGFNNAMQRLIPKLEGASVDHYFR